MDTFIILLVAVSMGKADLSAVDATVAATYKDDRTIEWTAQPTEIKDGVTYYRNVAFRSHLEKNMKAKATDISAESTVWTESKSKGVIVLTGNNWRETLDKAGFKPAEAVVKP